LFSPLLTTHFPAEVLFLVSANLAGKLQLYSLSGRIIAWWLTVWQLLLSDFAYDIPTPPHTLQPAYDIWRIIFNYAML
jgi:hypothetical protein